MKITPSHDTKYDVFYKSINDKDAYLIDVAQSEALINASNLINDAMLEKNISQKDLAKLLNVSKRCVSRLLSGDENMNVKDVARALYVLKKKYIQKTA